MNAPARIPTLRIAAITQGMRVVTPMGRIARVEGIALNTGEELHSRVLIKYLDCGDVVPLQAKLLRAYNGATVVFPDEAERLQAQYAKGKKQ
jgi:hypothetical protein